MTLEQVDQLTETTPMSSSRCSRKIQTVLPQVSLDLFPLPMLLGSEAFKKYAQTHFMPIPWFIQSESFFHFD